MTNASDILPSAVNLDTAPRVNRAFCHLPRTEKILRRFIAETAVACRAGEATFWAVSPDGKNLDGAINSGAKHDIIERASVPACDSVVGLSATTGISACIGPDDYMNPSIVKLTGIPVHAMVVAPVLSDEQVCGVVSAVNPAGGGIFNSGDLETLQWKAYVLGLLLADAAKGADAQ